MTEKEWLACGDPARMLEALQGAGDRKLRLFCCACCQRVRGAESPQHEAVVEIVERMAHGQVEFTERHRAAAELLTVEAAPSAHLAALFDGALYAASETAARASRAPSLIKIPPIVGGPGSGPNPAWTAAVRAEQAVQAALLHDIFGNPFRPASVDPAWRTSTVVALAEGIYAERTFDRMPILADALQDAGCDNEEVLNHCRDTSLTHVRGCWVVDLVLGKE